jgi:hypothetical protein
MEVEEPTMSIDPRSGGRYGGPIDDGGEPSPPPPQDPGFYSPNPELGEAGPLYLSPEAEVWVGQNVTPHGYVIDWGNRTIIDPETGEIKGTVPTQFPKVV